MTMHGQWRRRVLEYLGAEAENQKAEYQENVPDWNSSDAGSDRNRRGKWSEAVKSTANGRNCMPLMR